jgi:hypothetical protein
MTSPSGHLLHSEAPLQMAAGRIFLQKPNHLERAVDQEKAMDKDRASSAWSWTWSWTKAKPTTSEALGSSVRLGTGRRGVGLVMVEGLFDQDQVQVKDHDFCKESSGSVEDWGPRSPVKNRAAG